MLAMKLWVIFFSKLYELLNAERRHLEHIQSAISQCEKMFDMVLSDNG